MTATAREILEQHLIRPRSDWLTVRTELIHFTLINYAVPVARLRKWIPADRFDIPEFDIGGERLALLSVVPFVDKDFRYKKLPFLCFNFPQTNFRVYITDRATGESCAWFFGTTLGSRVVHVSRALWKIP